MTVKDFKLTGGDELEKALLELPARYQKSVMVNAFKKGAEIVAQDARQRASGIAGGRYAENIVVSRSNSDGSRAAGSIVVVAVKRGSFSKLAHLFEYGTDERFQKDGSFTGKIVATPHFRPALDTKSGTALDTIMRLSVNGIEQISKQLVRGLKKPNLRGVS